MAYLWISRSLLHPGSMEVVCMQCLSLSKFLTIHIVNKVHFAYVDNDVIGISRSVNVHVRCTIYRRKLTRGYLKMRTCRAGSGRKFTKQDLKAGLKDKLRSKTPHISSYILISSVSDFWLYEFKKSAKIG